MTPCLKVIRSGPTCTIQDGGRIGWLRYGVTPAGPMDWIAHREASVLAGNDGQSAAIEIGPGRLDVEADGAPLRIGLSAIGFDVRRGETAVASRGAITLMPGEQLTIKSGSSHLWSYLALAGGMALEPVMGSLSMHLRSGIGPLGGKFLTPAAEIPVAHPERGADLPDMECAAEPRSKARKIRFIPGPQDDYFTAGAISDLCSADYVVSPNSDRMGYRLDGPALRHAKGHDIVSDGIVMGAIQVPGDGRPIVLMADRQPTGGYPKIGTVIRADLPRLAQTRAGEAIQFERVSIAEAVEALRGAVLEAHSIVSVCRPMRQGIDLEKLASGDYVSGIVNAHAN